MEEHQSTNRYKSMTLFSSLFLIAHWLCCSQIDPPYKDLVMGGYREEGTF